MSHTEDTIATLKAIQDMGVKVAMDDFGTGYSSLSYLRRFPFDKIKIDKSFTADLGTCKDADSIVASDIQLGSSMGMVSNAEGVEHPEQAAFLRAQGCNEVQGFLYSKPMPSDSISELLADWEWHSGQRRQNVRPCCHFRSGFRRSLHQCSRRRLELRVAWSLLSNLHLLPFDRPWSAYWLRKT